MEISDVTDKEFKIMVISLLTKIRRTMHKQSENFNKETKYKKVSNRNHRAEDCNN